jgi:HEPN domain-containing protein
MSDREHAVKLLDAAQTDLNALRGMQDPAILQGNFFADEIFGFHCQQAVEKSFKAWLAFHGVRFAFTHDLMALIQNLDSIGVDVESLYEFVELNSFAVQYRYETLDPSDDDRLDREQVLARVEELFQRVKALIHG